MRREGDEECGKDEALGAGKGRDLGREGSGETLELLKGQGAPREQERGFGQGLEGQDKDPQHQPHHLPHPARNSHRSLAQQLLLKEGAGAAALPAAPRPELSAPAPAGIFSFCPLSPPRSADGHAE